MANLLHFSFAMCKSDIYIFSLDGAFFFFQRYIFSLDGAVVTAAGNEDELAVVTHISPPLPTDEQVFSKFMVSMHAFINHFNP